MDCETEISMERLTYPVTNDPELPALMTKVVQDVDPEAEIDSSHQTMGSEDFSFMMNDIPGCFIFVGSANPDKGLDYGHHHPKFNFDEACLPYAVAIIAQGAMEILQQDPKAD
jgi:amidohydrolase